MCLSDNVKVSEADAGITWVQSSSSLRRSKSPGLAWPGALHARVGWLWDANGSQWWAWMGLSGGGVGSTKRTAVFWSQERLPDVRVCCSYIKPGPIAVSVRAGVLAQWQMPLPCSCRAKHLEAFLEAMRYGDPWSPSFRLGAACWEWSSNISVWRQHGTVTFLELGCFYMDYLQKLRSDTKFQSVFVQKDK